MSEIKKRILVLNIKPLSHLETIMSIAYQSVVNFVML